jgi:hypothetical protein
MSLHRLAPVVLALAALSAAAAERVTVTYTPTARYADAGSGPAQIEANLAELAAHLQGLGQRLLAADEALEIELVDLDLAGEVRPSRRGNDLRVMRGGADWPRIMLRYRFAKGGQAQETRTETLSDMNYLMQVGRLASGDALYYEKRMLDDWFRARFAPAQ